MQTSYIKTYFVFHFPFQATLNFFLSLDTPCDLLLSFSALGDFSWTLSKRFILLKFILIDQSLIESLLLPAGFLWMGCIFSSLLFPFHLSTIIFPIHCLGWKRGLQNLLVLECRSVASCEAVEVPRVYCNLSSPQTSENSLAVIPPPAFKSVCSSCLSPF